MNIGLEFGCGNKPRKPEYLGVDIRSLPNVTYVCNAWEIHQHVKFNTIDNIFSRHFFEHLTFYQADLTLKSWYKILKSGGKIEMIVPNMEFHIRQWLNPNRKTVGKDERHAIAGFWGWQREDDPHNFWDVHKSGYDYNLLKDFVTDRNYINCVRIKSREADLHVKFEK